MVRGCKYDEYWDRLVRRCISCEKTCKHPHDRCAEFCASRDCRASPGHFYDALLKRCMQCAQLCGSHPVECAGACKAINMADTSQNATWRPSPPALSLTQLPVDRAALPSSTTRWSQLPRGEHHTVIIYSLLGLCLAVLFCTLSAALLTLLCRTRARRGQGIRGGHKAGPQEQEVSDDVHRPSSKDRLMDPVFGGQGHGPVEENQAWPTETCIHCFPELRVQRQVEDKPPPPTLYQQASGMPPPAGACTELQQDTVTVVPHHQGSVQGPAGKDAALRIICSPTQSG